MHLVVLLCNGLHGCNVCLKESSGYEVNTFGKYIRNQELTAGRAVLAWPGLVVRASLVFFGNVVSFVRRANVCQCHGGVCGSEQVFSASALKPWHHVQGAHCCMF